MAEATGNKFDSEKPRTDLLDPLALEGLAQVLTFGAKKYAAHNWRGGISYSRLLGAALRHIFAILRGEDVDPESGLPHVDHLGCCWMFLSNMMKTRKDLDDRYRPTVSESSSDQRDAGCITGDLAKQSPLFWNRGGECRVSMDGNP
jgi:hypothetical protein